MPAKPRFLILADGDFGPDDLEDRQLRHPLSPGAGGRRAGPGQLAGKTVQDVLGFGGAIPVVASMAEGLRPEADGDPHRHRARRAGGCRRSGGRGWPRRSTPGATSGAGCTPSWATTRCSPPRRRRRASDDPRRAAAPREPRRWPVGLAKDVDALVVLTVGTDCNVGKMTAQLQLVDKLNARGRARPGSSPPARPASSSRAGASRWTRSSPTSSPAPRSRYGAEGAQGRRHRAGGGAGEHQPPRLLAA